MSCRGRYGSTPPASGGNAPSPSHRPVHIAMERSPTRPEPMGNYAEYPAYENLRIPPAARASTPGPYGCPGQFDTFGSQIDYNLSWMPRDINLSELLDQNNSQNVTSRFRRMDNMNPQPQPASDANCTPCNANPLLSQEQAQDENSLKSKKNGKEREESLIEWFDRSCQKELKKHKGTSISPNGVPVPAATSVDNEELPELNLSKGVLQHIAGATVSQLEICCDLRVEPITELTEAVDNFAKAEAMCAFAGAVKAAEAAAESAPPELVEEAALASAKGFATDVKATSIHGELEGVRPIEVLGYVGVTKPKYPTKNK